MKIFFITSNESKLDNKIEYSILENKGLSNLTKLCYGKMNFKNENYTVTVFYIDIIPENLEKKHKDSELEKYEAKIKAKKNDIFLSDTFEGTISFIKNKNNFIYDFELKETKGLFNKVINPPPYIKFSKAKQLQIYSQIKEQYFNEDELLFQDLISDSKHFFIEQNIEKYSFDFYLENFIIIYNLKEIKDLLKSFSLEKIELSNDFDPERYKEILYKCENDPSIFIKYCNKKKDKYYNKFYSLLLFFKMNYDKKGFNDLLNKKELLKYSIDIILENINIFKTIKIPYEFIIEIIKIKYSSLSEIKKAFSLIDSTENLFIILNNTFSELSKTFTEEKLNVFEFVNQQKDDNLENIFYEAKKIFAHPSNENKFIFLNKCFFEKYIKLNNDKNIKDLQNLIIIHNIINIYKNIDNSLEKEFISDLLEKIHLTGLDLIKIGILKNEDLLDFIDKDEFFKANSDYNTENNIPLFILDGIILETINKTFFKRWKKSRLLKGYQNMLKNKLEFKSKFEKAFIYKAQSITDFEKIYKLIDYDRNKIYNESSFQYFFDKLMEILESSEIKIETNFSHSISFIFYLLNKIFFIAKEKSNEICEIILEKVIEKIFPNIQIIENIHQEIKTKYKNINKEIIDIIDYYRPKDTNNILKGREILIYLKKMKLIQTKKYILGYLYNFLIQKEDLFSENIDFSSFELFRAIQEEEFINNIPEILSSKYYNYIFKFREEIANIIKKGEIKYELINWSKQNLSIIERNLNIIFINKQLYSKVIKPNLNKFFNKIYEQINDFEMLLKQIKDNNIESICQSDIEKVENIKNNLKNKFLYEIDADKLKEEYKIIKTNIEKKFKLKSSIIFNNLLNLKEELNPSNNKEEIFKETESDFIQFKNIFEENINPKKDNILRYFFETLYEIDENNIEKELIFMINFFELNIEDINLKTLKDKIIILLTKQKIDQKINDNILLAFEMEKNNYNYLNKFKESLLKVDSLLNSNKMKEMLNKKNIELENIKLKLNEEKNIGNKAKYENTQLSINYIRYQRLLNLQIENLTREKEKYICAYIKTHDEKICFSFFCRKSDKIEDYISKFYDIYPHFILKDNNIFKIRDKEIDKNKSFEENGINDGNIILLFYNND